MTIMMQIADFLARIISLYSFFIWIRILLSWINPYPRQGSLTWYFAAIVDPYLNLFRSRHFRIGMLDFSPLFAIGLLSVVQSVLNIFSYYGTLRLSWCLQLIIQAFWNYGVSVFLMITIIMLVMRLIGELSHSPAFYNMNMITDGIISKVQELFFPGRLVKRTTLSIIALVIMVLCYFACKYALGLLINLAARIPF